MSRPAPDPDVQIQSRGYLYLLTLQILRPSVELYTSSHQTLDPKQELQDQPGGDRAAGNSFSLLLYGEGVLYCVQLVSITQDT